MAPAENPRSDASTLRALGVAFCLLGTGLLVLGAWGITAPFPPTIKTVTAALFGLGFGLAFLLTGIMYTVVARSGEELEVGEKGVSVTRDPLTGEREWIRPDVIQAATVRAGYSLTTVSSSTSAASRRPSSSAWARPWGRGSRSP
jgi:hypothetical protein